MSADAAGALYVGRVMHARLRPVAHRFRYRVFALLLDLDRLEEAGRLSPLLSVGRANLVSFRPEDHGAQGAEPLAAYARRTLAEAGVAAERVLLLCYPRIFGFAFNPLSLFYGLDSRGRLAGAIAEVRNTYGERHAYVLRAQDGARPEAAKAFHVSPFLPMGLTYRFGLEPPGGEARISIVERDGDGPLLTAVFAGARRPLDTRGLLGALARTPLMTAKVVAAIHLEALRLLAKGVPALPHPGRRRSLAR